MGLQRRGGYPIARADYRRLRAKDERHIEFSARFNFEWAESMVRPGKRRH